MKKEAHRPLTLVNHAVNGFIAAPLLHLHNPGLKGDFTKLANKTKKPVGCPR